MSEKIVYESHGMKAVLSLEKGNNILKNPQSLREFANELTEFYTYFWGNDLETWQGIPEITAQSFFENAQYLTEMKNEE